MLCEELQCTIAIYLRFTTTEEGSSHLLKCLVSSKHLASDFCEDTLSQRNLGRPCGLHTVEVCLVTQEGSLAHQSSF